MYLFRATNCTYYTRMVLPAYLRDKDFAADIKVSLLTKQRSIAIGRNLVVAGILRPLISSLTPQSQPDVFKAHVNQLINDARAGFIGVSDTLMDAKTGAVLQHRGYDVFGRPRDIASGNNLLTSWQGVTKGYTDHEHLNEQELIHMNGRIYDFNIGRFLSVDPFLQFPENSQSANPYSYILNNPMSGTDPTGYSAVRSGNASAWRVASCDSNYGNSCAKTPVDNIMAQWGLSNGQSNESLAKQSQQRRNQKKEDKAEVGQQADTNNESIWTDQDGNPTSRPASFNGTETAFNDLGGDFRLRPLGVSVEQDQATRSEASGQAGFAGAMMLTGGALSAYIGAEATGLVFIAGSSGDIVDVAMARLPVTKSKTHGHHSDPKFMGGEKKQPLTTLNEQVHKDLHKDMNDFLKNKTDDFGNHMRPQRGNSGQKIRQNFTRQERLEALRDFYRGEGAKYKDAATDFFKQHSDL
ncbi:hypothetical protein GCM10009347_41650 [Shewanella algicola]|uniref:RHS repeat-associated core domain-containing protein n=1 Tax=Shewanella algicola TaxID=640633 RepID=A0A9X2CFV1_9GAMM|nr:RHS repeat-associated core domain-containing protein [Shewanella algicola]MCL1107757.1 hypothetical protein [Shewanella algicola]GGP72663.1 hypothetical protein GCM10009347_41650 [Shewanella algicola]